MKNNKLIQSQKGQVQGGRATTESRGCQERGSFKCFKKSQYSNVNYATWEYFIKATLIY